MQEDIITLDVGGTLFKTTKRTLRGCTLFKDMFEGCVDENETLFIDRSPEIFEHVLELLRNPKYDFPEIHKSELEYFGIEITKKIKEYKIINCYSYENFDIRVSNALNDGWKFRSDLKIIRSENDTGGNTIFIQELIR